MINYKLIVLVFALTMFPRGKNNNIPTSLLNKDATSVNRKEETKRQEDGKAIYMKYCMSCHQIDGSGVPGMYPPLQKSDWVSGDKKKLISTVLTGLQGEIQVNGEIYSQVMPKQDYLTDEQLARVLTFIRQNLGNKAILITAKDVANLRPKKLK